MKGKITRATGGAVPANRASSRCAINATGLPQHRFEGDRSIQRLGYIDAIEPLLADPACFPEAKTIVQRNVFDHQHMRIEADLLTATAASLAFP